MNVLLFTSASGTLDWMRLAISIRGHSSDRAETVDAALALIAGSAYDLVIIDHTHSDENDALNLCRRMREQPRSLAIPVWSIVDRERPASALAAIDAGATSLLLHPIDARQLRLGFDVLEGLLGPNAFTRSLGEGEIWRLLELLDDRIAIIDRVGVIRRVAPGFQQFTRVAAGELAGVNIEVLCHSDDIPILLSTIRSAVTNPADAIPAVVRLRGSATAWRQFEIRAIDLLDVPSVNGILLVLREKDASEPLRQTNVSEPLIDPITGLATPRLFGEHLDLALARAERANRSLAIIVAKLPGPSEPPVDEQDMLRVASHVRRAVRSSDVATMLGSRTLAVLADDIGGDEDAEAAAERLRDAVSTSMEWHSTLIEHPVTLEIVIGRPGTTTRDEMLEAVRHFARTASMRHTAVQSLKNDTTHVAIVQGVSSIVAASGPGELIEESAVEASLASDETVTEQSGDVIDRFLALEAHIRQLLNDAAG